MYCVPWFLASGAVIFPIRNLELSIAFTVDCFSKGLVDSNLG